MTDTVAPVLWTHADVAGVNGVEIVKVVGREEVDAWPRDRVLVCDGSGGSIGAAGSWEPADEGVDWGRIRVGRLRRDDVVRVGDVVRLREGASQVHVLWRRGANANSLFATERCNSYCLMCSQPPRDDNDAARVEEMLRIIELIDRDERFLGITGGEPTLLGEGLMRVLATARRLLPETAFHVLTNGRAFVDYAFARLVHQAGGEAVLWAVPLYADIAEVHDHVVQAAGAFDETLDGLFHLAALGARVELRIVLHRLTAPRLVDLAEFIYRRLPFVEHVAFMGLEPMGFARVNRDILWIDPADYAEPLQRSVLHLAERGLNVSIYNLPLCVVPEAVRDFSRQSISDWKNAYAPECDGCVGKEVCGGFFASAGPNWRSRAVQPFVSAPS